MGLVDTILCAFAALIGVGLLLAGVFDLRKANRARSWPVAEGRILESRVREKSDSDGTSYEVAILYEYSVNGRTHRSDIWRVRAGSSSTKAASRTIASYPVGSAVPVYFNPEDPADAMLEPGKISWALLFAGVAFAAAGVAGVLQNL